MVELKRILELESSLEKVLRVVLISVLLESAFKLTIMNFLIFFLLSFFPILISSHSHHKPCLTDVAATTLITKWFTLFTSADSSQFGALTSAVLTDDFTYEDETLNFAIGLCFVKAEGPIAPSRAIFVEILKARLADSGTVDEKHEALDTVRSCNKIAVRVQNSASTRGNIPNKSV